MRCRHSLIASSERRQTSPDRVTTVTAYIAAPAVPDGLLQQLLLFDDLLDEIVTANITIPWPFGWVCYDKFYCSSQSALVGYTNYCLPQPIRMGLF